MDYGMKYRGSYLTVIMDIAWKSQRRHIYPLLVSGSYDIIYQVLLLLSAFDTYFLINKQLLWYVHFYVQDNIYYKGGVML